ncbi:MAG: hypothetical protein C4288_09370 [Leptolyngbya sp. ERB_1_1]
MGLPQRLTIGTCLCASACDITVRSSVPILGTLINLKQFDVNNIHAYGGDPSELDRANRAKGQALPLAKVGGNQPANAKDTVVAFDPPIQPGNMVTITIDVPRNPSQDIYLIGVTAYPTGSNPMGQFLGFGRFSFYSNQ